jgi:hypothetical protein
MKAIDITPSWGEWGNAFWGIARLQAEAINPLHKDFAQAMAAAQALNAISKTLTAEQVAIAQKVVARELEKQGVTE